MPTPIKISEFPSIVTNQVTQNSYLLMVLVDGLGVPVNNFKITYEQIGEVVQVPTTNLLIPSGTADNLTLVTENGTLVLKEYTAEVTVNPGGTGTELQYRNGTEFGGIPNSSWNGTALGIPKSLELNGDSNTPALISSENSIVLTAYNANSVGPLSQLILEQIGGTTGQRVSLSAFSSSGSSATLEWENDSEAPLFNGQTVYHSGNLPPSGGGSTIPGGTGTQLQFRNGSTFDGVDNSSWDGTTLGLPKNIILDGDFSEQAQISSERGVNLTSNNTNTVGAYSEIAISQDAETSNQIIKLTAYTDTNLQSVFEFDSNSDAPTFNGQTMYHSGNLPPSGGDLVTSVSGRTGDVILTDADVVADVLEWNTASKTAILDDRGVYVYATASGAKTYEFTTAVGSVPGEYHIRNDAISGDITLIATGVTLKVPKGGTLVLEPGDTVTIKRVTNNIFHIFGSTKAA